MTQTESKAAEASEVQRGSPFGRAALRIHHQRATSRGERAQLRRVSLHREAPPGAFWEVLHSAGLEPEAMSDDRLDLWVYLVAAMTRHPHARGARLGRVLAQHGTAASRIERWLRRNRPSAAAELSRLLSVLPAGTALDWDRLGWLLVKWTIEDRRRFAADYFAQKRRVERAAEQEETDG